MNLGPFQISDGTSACPSMRFVAVDCVARAHSVELGYKLRGKIKSNQKTFRLAKGRGANYPVATPVPSTFAFCRRITFSIWRWRILRHRPIPSLFPFNHTLEFLMQQNHLEYDSATLRARLIQRHGTDLGTIVYDAELSRRQAQDVRASELSNELIAVQAETSALLRAHGERRAKSQEQLAGAYAGYIDTCNETAKLDSFEQATIAPLTARARELQQQMRDIALPRLSERELQNLAVFYSADAAQLRAVGKQLSPPASPPPTALAKINMSVGLQKPRS